MSLLSAFFNQKIGTICTISRNEYGDKVLSAIYTNVPCRWQETNRTVMQSESEIKRIRADVWLNDSYSSITENYIFIKDGKQYKVYSVELRYNLDGNIDHVRVELE